jgi:hypothetical protein
VVTEKVLQINFPQLLRLAYFDVEQMFLIIILSLQKKKKKEKKEKEKEFVI